MEPIPGGFPSAKRTPTRRQVRVTPERAREDRGGSRGVIGRRRRCDERRDQRSTCRRTAAARPRSAARRPAEEPVRPDRRSTSTQRAGDQPRLELTRRRARRGSTSRCARASRPTTRHPGQGTAGRRLRRQRSTPRAAAAADDIQDRRADHFHAGRAPRGTTRVAVGTVAISQNLTTDDVALDRRHRLHAREPRARLRSSACSSDQLDRRDRRTRSRSQTCKACESGNVAECGCRSRPRAPTTSCMQGDAAACRSSASRAAARQRAVRRACRPARPARSISTRSPAATRRRTTTASRSACSAACCPAARARDRCGPPATAPAPVDDPAVAVLPGQHAARQRPAVRRRLRPPQVAARAVRVRRLRRRPAVPDDRRRARRAAVDRHARPAVALARQARREQLADGGRPAPAEPAGDRARQEHVQATTARAT